MRARRIAAAIFFVSGLVHAQAKPVEQCTGNFEEAQLKERRGKLVEAEQLYAACAEPKCPKMVRADCEAKRVDVERRVPTITVAIRDASGKDIEAVIDIDGARVEDRLHLRAIDPGEHTVHYRIAGQPPGSEKIAIVEGEKARVVAITVAPAGNENAKAGTKATSADSESTRSLVGPLIVGGVGVVLIGIAVYLQVNAISEQNDSEPLKAEAENPDRTAAERQAYLRAWSSKHDSAKNNQTFAIVLGGAGLLALAGGITWYLVTRSPPKDRAFVPVVTPTYAGAAFGLTF